MKKNYTTILKLHNILKLKYIQHEYLHKSTFNNTEKNRILCNMNRLCENREHGWVSFLGKIV